MTRILIAACAAAMACGGAMVPKLNQGASGLRVVKDDQPIVIRGVAASVDEAGDVWMYFATIPLTCDMPAKMDRPGEIRLSLHLAPQHHVDGTQGWVVRDGFGFTDGLVSKTGEELAADTLIEPRFGGRLRFTLADHDHTPLKNADGLTAIGPVDTRVTCR